MNNSTDYSDIKFGVQDSAERSFWATYYLCGVLSSLTGDTLILLASCQLGIAARLTLVPVALRLRLLSVELAPDSFSGLSCRLLRLAGG